MGANSGNRQMSKDKSRKVQGNNEEDLASEDMQGHKTPGSRNDAILQVDSQAEHCW